MDCTFRVVKTKALISFAVTAKLICVFVFAYANCWFSQAGFDTKGSPRLLNYYVGLLVFTCRQSDGLLESGGKYDTKFLVLSFSVDSKHH